MKKSIISMIIVLTMLFSFSAFAASGFHKVNGWASEKGAGGSYTSTTTITCTKITAQGTSDNNRKVVTIMVQSSSGKVVANKTITLNGTETTLANFYTPFLSPDTYKVTVASSDTVPFEVSTFFYK